MSQIKVIPSKIERVFNAPRQLVFEAWTKVEHLNNWMFPMPGCTCDYKEANITNGGTSLHKVTMPNGHEMWLHTKFEEVVSPEKLVFLQYMSNEAGEIVEMSHIPNWPKDMLATLHFEALGDQQTKLTFLWEPRNPTGDELQAFEATRSDHDKGWGAGMAQLEAYLATL